jgi:hypothetical protein
MRKRGPSHRWNDNITIGFTKIRLGREVDVFFKIY